MAELQLNRNLMINNITKIDLMHKERGYTLLCGMDTPIVELIEALDEMKKVASEILEKSSQPQESKEEECLSI